MAFRPWNEAAGIMRLEPRPQSCVIERAERWRLAHLASRSEAAVEAMAFRPWNSRLERDAALAAAAPEGAQRTSTFSPG